MIFWVQMEHFENNTISKTNRLYPFFWDKIYGYKKFCPYLI